MKVFPGVLPYLSPHTRCVLALAQAAEYKTTGYYFNVLWKAVRDAYDGLLTAFEFEQIFLDQIASQFRRGFYDGLRAVGLNPPKDMKPEWEAELQKLMTQEITYVQRLMDDIVAAAKADSGYAQFRSRIDIWSQRYEEIKSLAIMLASQTIDGMVQWVIGRTEESCWDCLKYAAMGPQTAAYWLDVERSTGHRPQSRALACHGYNCKCQFVRVPQPMDGLFVPMPM